ncbi:hypothetical protein A3736_12780 [Erythrobacter sp. HI0063]|nr:hypothetical protein A3736_12780 [Erythrobacter sp. HI0063]
MRYLRARTCGHRIADVEVVGFADDGIGRGGEGYGAPEPARDLSGYPIFEFARTQRLFRARR